MKILLSAFAFKPNSGSETGVGWHWAVELARLGHEVVVLTDSSREVDVLADSGLQNEPNLTVVCHRPAWLRTVPLNSRTAQMLFSAWQYSILPKALQLERRFRFDAIIHLTYGVFRHPSFLGFLGPAFIFGPVGGGEDAPWALKRSLPFGEKLKEAIRQILNSVARFNPFLCLALSQAKLILSKTEDTRLALPRAFQAKTVVFPEIGIEPRLSSPPALAARSKGEVLDVLFVGRMHGWKGAHLALAALAAALKQGAPVRLTMVGAGPLLDWNMRLAQQMGIADRVTWIERLPQSELFSLYGRMHCFLFPSLHDSSGNVVLEALSFGLPVICLDVGGPATLVDETCARVIQTAKQSEQSVVQHMGQVLLALADEDGLRLELAKGAWSKAQEMTWKSRARGALDILSRVN